MVTRLQEWDHITPSVAVFAFFFYIHCDSCINIALLFLYYIIFIIFLTIQTISDSHNNHLIFKKKKTTLQSLSLFSKFIYQNTQFLLSSGVQCLLYNHSIILSKTMELLLTKMFHLWGNVSTASWEFLKKLCQTNTTFQHVRSTVLCSVSESTSHTCFGKQSLASPASRLHSLASLGRTLIVKAPTKL